MNSHAMSFSSAILVMLIFLTGKDGAHGGIFNAGPYDLKLTRIDYCEDQGTGEFTGDLHLVKKSSRKAFFQGYIYIPYDYDDTIRTDMNFSRRGAQGWGNNAYVYKIDKTCSTFKRDYSTLFYFIFHSLGVKNPDCPIKAGNYTVDMDSEFPQLPKLPYLPYGNYRISLAYLHGNPPVRFSCTVWYITCAERPR